MPTQFFTDSERQFSTLYGKQRRKMAKTILNNKRTAGDPTSLNFKLYCRALIIKPHGIGIKTDMLINEIKQKTQT